MYNKALTSLAILCASAAAFVAVSHTAEYRMPASIPTPTPSPSPAETLLPLPAPTATASPLPGPTMTPSPLPSPTFAPLPNMGDDAPPKR